MAENPPHDEPFWPEGGEAPATAAEPPAQEPTTEEPVVESTGSAPKTQEELDQLLGR